MKKPYAVSLYYRLFLVFGLSFVMLIAVLCLAVSSIVDKKSAQHFRNLVVSSAPEIRKELGENPTQDLIASVEEKYGVEIDSKVPSKIRPALAHISFTEDTFVTIILTLVSVFGIMLLNSFLVRRLLGPIGEITAAVTAYAQGRFSVRLKSESDDEIGTLSRNFDSMADRIQSQVESLKHMAVGVSHEIRSPLARMRLAIESLNDGQASQILANEIRNIDRIVEITLERESLDSGLSELQLQDVQINELLEELADYYRQSNLEIQTSLEPFCIHADRRRLEILFKNLLDNCFEHGRPPVSIRLETAANNLEVSIGDAGAGFTSLKPGFGLSLCESIAKAHGGSLQIERTPGAGGRVSVKLPRFS